MTAERDLLEEQVAYYRARAAEYDATSTPDGDPFAAAGEALRRGLRELPPRGRVLEIAAGTGQWTGILADTADMLVVTDSAPEMLALNRARTGDRPNVRYEIADAFELDRLGAVTTFDLVAFGFFLSHVPRATFASFWGGIQGVLGPSGRVWFADEGRHDLWREDWLDEPAGVVRRTLRSGQAHRAVKVRWAPHELEATLRELGWDASVHEASPFFWGTAVPAKPRRPPGGSAE
jgi:SAM-dependent methyltransferase